VRGVAAREFALTRTWARALAPLYEMYRDASGAAAPSTVVVGDPRRVA
jgi:hypothetical protein